MICQRSRGRPRSGDRELPRPIRVCGGASANAVIIARGGCVRKQWSEVWDEVVVAQLGKVGKVDQQQKTERCRNYWAGECRREERKRWIQQSLLKMGRNKSTRSGAPSYGSVHRQRHSHPHNTDRVTDKQLGRAGPDRLLARSSGSRIDICGSKARSTV